MKIIRINYYLIFSIIIVLCTLTASAEKLEYRTITACYSTVLLQNASNTSTYAPAQTDLASFVTNKITTNQIKFLKQLPSNEVTDCGETHSFCCARFTEAQLGTPATVPTLKIGTVTAQWVVASIEFHN